ncbi:uncharacterized protein LOC126474067 [Schistocerca serialis cubense]|uniref:uncharacterized protein LOC126474067 n=1 Tax=Schistocerca serialis cubense TaxID=2023355 RepID=UPI00214E887F|nr:uncharacterized protein LOC126474067 [Schistocerca serialis cubense]
MCRTIAVALWASVLATAVLAIPTPDSAASSEAMVMEETTFKTGPMADQQTAMPKDPMTNVEKPMANEMPAMMDEMMNQESVEDAMMHPMAEPPMVEMEENRSPSEDSGPADQEATGRSAGYETVADAFKRIYSECMEEGSFSCVKPKVTAFLRATARKDAIFLTRDLAIEKTGAYSPTSYEYVQDNEAEGPDMLSRVERFLGSHALRVRLPEELRSGRAAQYVPAALLSGLHTEVRVPLADPAVAQSEARGFMKKVVMPFLLGLKFKAAAVLPLALALIALKTWKALTLGLLSLVLTGAMLIFRLSKPKVVSYEVVHYPHATVEHHAAPAPAPYDHHGYGRALPSGAAADLPYRAYAPSTRR